MILFIKYLHCPILAKHVKLVSLNDGSITYTKQIRKLAANVISDVSTEKYLFDDETVEWKLFRNLITSDKFDLDGAHNGLRAFSRTDAHVQASSLVDLAIGIYIDYLLSNKLIFIYYNFYSNYIDASTS